MTVTILCQTMEKALHITKTGNLKYLTPGFARIYFGTEFCQNLIPSVEDLEKAINFSRMEGLRFTFVTPFVTEKGLCRLDHAFHFLKRRLEDCEVVVNDWGVLEVLSKKYKTFKPVLGRLLTRQNRDPAVARIFRKQVPYVIKDADGKLGILLHIPPGKLYQRGVKSSYVNTFSVYSFLAKLNVGRIELNNLIQGVDFEGLKFKVSLYTPFVNISTTRFCPMETRLQKTYRINVCKKECQRYYDRLKYNAGATVIYKRGNTLFYRNPIRLRTLNKEIVDRIIFQPELPF